MSAFDNREERLNQLFGAYFNQDWREDAADEFAVMDEYAFDHRCDRVDGSSHLCVIVKDLEWLIEAHKSRTNDEFWDTLTRRYGSEFTGKFIGMSAEQWVQSLVDRLVLNIRTMKGYGRDGRLRHETRSNSWNAFV